jgi:hypothetical protein
MKITDIAFNVIEVIDDIDKIELIYDREAERRIKCICGAIILKKNIERHDTSKRHINYLDKLIGRNIIVE